MERSLEGESFLWSGHFFGAERVANICSLFPLYSMRCTLNRSKTSRWWQLCLSSHSIILAHKEKCAFHSFQTPSLFRSGLALKFTAGFAIAVGADLSCISSFHHDIEGTLASKSLLVISHSHHCHQCWVEVIDYSIKSLITSKQRTAA